MCHKKIAIRTERGFTLVTAIFLLLVLAGLGAFMISFSTVQHSTSAQDVQGTKAYQAARAGLEWGLYQALQTPACASATWTMTGALQDFSVKVVCQNAGTFTENATPVSIYRITSTASYGQAGSSSYVERELEATVAN